MLAHLVARLAYVGLSCGQCGPSLELCGGLSWAMLAHLGAMLTYLGAMWRGYVGPILGLCWPILGLRWSILGLSWPILVAMLAHLGGYVGASLAGGRSAAGAAAPLSYGEERTAVRQCHGHAGGPWPDKGLRPLPPTPGHSRLMAKSNPGKETMPDAHAAGKAGTRRHRYTNNTASLQLAGVLLQILQLAYVLYSQWSTVPNVAF